MVNNRSARRKLATVARTTNPTRTLWEAILPPGFDNLPAELARIDALFDDPVFTDRMIAVSPATTAL